MSTTNTNVTKVKTTTKTTTTYATLTATISSGNSWKIESIKIFEDVLFPLANFRYKHNYDYCNIKIKCKHNYDY